MAIASLKISERYFSSKPLTSCPDRGGEQAFNGGHGRKADGIDIQISKVTHSRDSDEHVNIDFEEGQLFFLTEAKYKYL
jgi:hypothetical protein